MVEKSFRFESSRLIYRGIDIRDAAQLVKWRSDPEVIRYFLDPTPLTLEAHCAWFETYLTNTARYDYIIQRKTDRHSIGFLSANQLDLHEGSCYISYTIADRQCRMQGYGVEAVMALCSCFCEKEGIHRFFSVVHEDNIASLKVMEKIRFAPKAKERDFVTFWRVF